MKVLFVNENLGGHGALHLHLRRALLAEHPDVAAHFVDVPPPGLARRVASLPIPGLARFDADLQPLRAQVALSATVARTLARVARDYDVVHVYSQNAGLLSGGILRSVPAVVSTDTTNLINAYQLPYRAPGPGTAPSLRPAMFLERRVFDAATLVVAQSEWAARELERYGVPRHRMRVIPFGITVDPIATARPGPGPPRVTFVGTTMDRKGGWTLLRAYRESLAGRCRLTLVTRDRVPSTPGVEVVNDAFPGDGRVAGLLAETSVFALPTEIDKSPYSVLEAMAAGVPVVSTTVGAIPEIVGDQLAGILVPPGDHRAVAKAIASLLDDPDRRSRMGAAARARALERFDARRTTADLVRVLEEAVRQHRRR
ncbi:MAG TPA: glycosyltransferase family 4 protein [Acidimicrobiales bacterium]|nr:glycosyltransferase family 4 protein [Acidimicrobiales bacterium]